VALPADQVERIFEWSEGNPFYAEQLAAAGAGDALMVLPATLADVLLARIQALTGPAQELLRAAAVAGRRVPHRLLAQVLGWPEPDLEEALRTTIGAGVLMVDASILTCLAATIPYSATPSSQPVSLPRGGRPCSVLLAADPVAGR
jgi:hypothetical protein